MVERCFPAALHLVKAEGDSQRRSFPQGVREPLAGSTTLGSEPSLSPWVGNNRFFPLLPSPIDIVRQQRPLERPSRRVPLAQVSCRLLIFGLASCKLIAPVDPLKCFWLFSYAWWWWWLFFFSKEGVRRGRLVQGMAVQPPPHLKNSHGLCSSLRSWIDGSLLVL